MCSFVVEPVDGTEFWTEIDKFFQPFITLDGLVGLSQILAAIEGTTNMSLYLSVANECILD